MRTAEQVAQAVVAKVVDKVSTGAELSGQTWRNVIVEEVTAFKKEYNQAVGRAIVKVKSIKPKQREALAKELDAILESK